MNAMPNSFQEIVDAPEIPENFEGKVIDKVEYRTKRDEPNISFMPLLFKTQVETKECKWYISNATAACLQSCGHRDSCIMPIEPKIHDLFCYFYNYEVTKRYAEWYFAEKGKFIYKRGRQCHYHFILLFFCEDKNWAPFHYDLMHQLPPNVKLQKLITFSVTEITEKLLGCEKIERNEQSYTKEEIGFMRILVALTAYRPEFREKDAYNNFVECQLNEYKKWTGLEISFESFILKADYEQFHQLSFLNSSTLLPLIYCYFFSLSNLEGTFVQNALKKYTTVSPFNIIYRFLRVDDKRLVHFDEVILKEARLYINKIERLSSALRDRLPFAELLSFNFTAGSDNWKNLAGVAYLYTMDTLSVVAGENHKKFLDKLEKSIPNLDENMKLAPNYKKNKIYEQFEEMSEIHENMKNIPWKQYTLSHRYADYLCEQLLDNNFY